MQFRTKCTLLSFCVSFHPTYHLHLPYREELVGLGWLCLHYKVQSAGLSSSLGSGQLSMPGYSLRTSAAQGLLPMYHSKTIMSSREELSHEMLPCHCP